MSQPQAETNDSPLNHPVVVKILRFRWLIVAGLLLSLLLYPRLRVEGQSTVASAALVYLRPMPGKSLVMETDSPFTNKQLEAAAQVLLEHGFEKPAPNQSRQDEGGPEILMTRRSGLLSGVKFEVQLDHENHILTLTYRGNASLVNGSQEDIRAQAREAANQLVCELLREQPAVRLTH